MLSSPMNQCKYLLFVFPRDDKYRFDVYLINSVARNAKKYYSWAIGTGLTATPEQAQETHAAIRQYLGEIAGADVAADTRILYGGSASGKTAPGLSQKEDIDGKCGTSNNILQ